MLRLFQAISLVFVSYPLFMAQVLFTYPATKHTLWIVSLAKLLNWLNVTRRALRLFRFLEAWKRSHALYENQAQKSIEDWLDIISASTLGMYGMLETATMVDVIRIEDLEIFGQERSKVLNHRAQMFWLASLYTAVLSSGIKLLRLLAYRAVPASGEGFSADTTNEKESSKSKLKQSEDEKAVEGAKRKEERAAAVREHNAKVSQFGLKIISDLLDLTIPIAATGMMKIFPGVVGIAMFFSTLITGRNVWIRCAADVQKRAK